LTVVPIVSRDGESDKTTLSPIPGPRNASEDPYTPVAWVTPAATVMVWSQGVTSVGVVESKSEANVRNRSTYVLPRPIRPLLYMVVQSL